MLHERDGQKPYAGKPLVAAEVPWHCWLEEALQLGNWHIDGRHMWRCACGPGRLIILAPAEVAAWMFSKSRLKTMLLGRCDVGRKHVVLATYSAFSTLSSSTCLTGSVYCCDVLRCSYAFTSRYGPSILSILWTPLWAHFRSFDILFSCGSTGSAGALRVLPIKVHMSAFVINRRIKTRLLCWLIYMIVTTL